MLLVLAQEKPALQLHDACTQTDRERESERERERAREREREREKEAVVGYPWLGDYMAAYVLALLRHPLPSFIRDFGAVADWPN